MQFQIEGTTLVKYDFDHQEEIAVVPDGVEVIGKYVRNLHIKMAHAPYFASRTWQEKALKILKDEPIYEDLPLTTS